MENANAGSVLQKPLIKRLTFSAIIVAIVAFFNFYTSGWVLFLCVEAIICLCLLEYYSMVEKKKMPVHRTLGLVFGLLTPLSVFLPIELVLIPAAILVLFLVGFDKNSPTTSESLTMTAVTLFGVIYISWLLSTILKLHAIPDTGARWVFFVIFAVKMGDAGAYFVGKNFGKTKLLPHISPNKSVEGSIACTVVTIASSLFGKVFLPEVPMIHFLILGVILGILAQIGDLVESLIKRNLGVKDSGIIPGLGGMLDIMDSLIFSIPFVYCYVTAVPGVLPR